MNQSANTENILNSIVNRFEAIRESDIANKKKQYRRMILRQGIRSDAEFKGIILTELELDQMTEELLTE
jgi:hypothetical protein